MRQRRDSIWIFYRRLPMAARLSIPLAVLLLAGGLSILLVPRLTSHQPRTALACDSPATLARIRVPEEPLQPYEQRVLHILACAGASGELGYTVHGLTLGPNIAVYDSLSKQADADADADAAQRLILHDAFVLERAIWQSDLHPAAVLVQFSVAAGGKPLGAYCELDAETAGRTNWAQEEPAHAWSILYTEAVPRNLSGQS